MGNSNNFNTQTVKVKRRTWLVVVLGLFCLFLLMCMALVVVVIGKVILERAPVESVLDAFMREMSEKDVESTYDLFSPRAQRQISKADLEKMIQVGNAVLFDGYQGLSIQNLRISVATNTDQDLPQGTIANVTGEITYEDGFVGHFESVLEKVNGTWKLHQINLTVPPDKIRP